MARRKHKYFNEPKAVGELRFASTKERDRYLILLGQLRTGAITDLRIHPRYPLRVEGERVATYVADFEYLDAAGRLVVEDVKGFKTPAYRLKAKLFAAIYGQSIVEM